MQKTFKYNNNIENFIKRKNELKILCYIINVNGKGYSFCYYFTG